MIINVKPRIINYIDFTLDYMDAMLDLCNDRFGEGYLNEETLCKYVEDDDYFCKIAVDFESNKLLGFSVFFATNISDLLDEFNLSTKDVEDIIDENDKLCVIKTVALQRDVEKLGLANELLKISIETMRDMGFNSMWGSAWIRKNGRIPAKKLLERNNFNFLKITHLTFFNNLDYICPDCQGRCRCNDAIYYKILN